MAPDIALRWHEGPRAPLRRLFELAEDSPSQLDGYIDEGRVLVATTGDGATVGHLQLVPTRHNWAIEIKNMAVDPAWEGRGVGRALVARAASTSREARATTLTVLTAAADVGNLRFYQRVGFRIMAVERDRFTPANGYPDGLSADGIELRDGVRLAMDVTRLAPQPNAEPARAIRTRVATDADRPDITRMLPLVLDPAIVPSALADLELAIATPGGDVEFGLAVGEDGRSSGVIWLAERPWAAGCEGSPVGYVEGWYVDAGQRARGVGRALMEHGEQWARRRGYTWLGSDTDPHNAPSIAAHVALGFREAGTSIAFARRVATEG